MISPQAWSSLPLWVSFVSKRVVFFLMTYRWHNMHYIISTTIMLKHSKLDNHFLSSLEYICVIVWLYLSICSEGQCNKSSGIVLEFIDPPACKVLQISFIWIYLVSEDSFLVLSHPLWFSASELGYHLVIDTHSLVLVDSAGYAIPR